MKRSIVIRTKRAAIREAKRRWGKTGDVDHNAKLPAEGKPLAGTGPHGPRYHRCRVGFVAMGLFFEVRGEGSTWTRAFADADHRDRQDRERMAKLRAERA